MNESDWAINHIQVINFGKRKEIAVSSPFCVMGDGLGENSSFSDIEVEMLQYNSDGVAKNIRFQQLNGVLSRLGQNKNAMRFHLTWLSCLKILKECEGSKILPVLDKKIIWREINECIEMLLKNSR